MTYEEQLSALCLEFAQSAEQRRREYIELVDAYRAEHPSQLDSDARTRPAAAAPQPGWGDEDEFWEFRGNRLR